ncbi:MAG: hypothetical protein HQL38_00870 [Alphaproteobacteria bacterium]|nr:hypothetical protein [Alphaproteobacteria bacterium]
MPPAPEDLAVLIDRAAVARLLGIRLKKLYRCIGRLRRNPANPFPPPVLGRGAGARWNPRDVQRWIEAGGEFAEALELGCAERDDWAERLDDRARRLAQRRER